MATGKATIRSGGPFFGKVPEGLIFSDDPCASNACRLYAALDRQANKEDQALPSREYLAERLGMSLSTMEQTLSFLQEQGYLVVERRDW